MSTSIPQECSAPPSDTSAFERYLGGLLAGMTNEEAGAVIGVHPAWIPTRRQGKKWGVREAFRLADHLGKTLGDLAREAETR